MTRRGSGSTPRWPAAVQSRSRCCQPRSAPSRESTEVPSDEAGMRRFERPQQLPPDLKVTRTYLFEGGCVTYKFEFEGDASTSLVFEADQALAFQPRSDLVDWVDERTDLSLCGASARRAQVASDPRRRRSSRSRSASSSRWCSPWRPHPCRSVCSACGAGGRPRCSPARSAGGLRHPGAEPVRLGLGGRRPRAAHRRDRDPRHDGGCGHARPARSARLVGGWRTRGSRLGAATIPRGEPAA